MPPEPKRRRILCLVGPTGAGKTRSALDLAARYQGSVINLDSRQVYADFPLITAQPSPEERGHCPHLLYGFLSCDEKMTAMRFATLARTEIDRVAEAGGLPILVGGTGLYLRALIEGLAEIPPVPEAVSREVGQEIVRRGVNAMHAELTGVDPVYAATIHANDTQRVHRALEVFRATGKPLSHFHAEQKQQAAAFDLVAKVLLAEMDLVELEPRLAQRIEWMLTEGALEEARAAWERCPNPDAPGWTGIGCAELLAYIRGELSLDEAKARWLANTRAYAKRQLTWFKKEPNVLRFRPGEHAAFYPELDAFLGAGGATE